MARFQTLLAWLVALVPLVLSAKNHGKASRVRIPGAYIFEFEDGKVDDSRTISPVNTC